MRTQQSGRGVVGGERGGYACALVQAAIKGFQRLYLSGIWLLGCGMNPQSACKHNRVPVKNSASTAKQQTQFHEAVGTATHVLTNTHRRPSPKVNTAINVGVSWGTKRPHKLIKLITHRDSWSSMCVPLRV